MKIVSRQWVIFVILLLIHPTAWAQYKISNDVVGSGGAKSEDGTNILQGTVGQFAIGIIDTVPYRNDVGFWYQLGYVITSIDTDRNKWPKIYSLEQNYPNPFNPSTTIQFALPEKTHAKLNIYDVRGRLVAAVVDKEMDPGIHRVSFNASHLASGVYFYRLQTKNFVKTKKLVLVK
jgi:hypothetical protein